MTAPIRRPALPQPVSNVLANWGAFAVTIVIGFTLSPYIVHHLGATLYGAWVTVGSMIGYLGLLDLGVRGAVTRYIAYYEGRHDPEAQARIAASALALFTVGAALALALGAVLAVVMPRYLDMPAADRPEVGLAIAIAAATVAVSLVGNVYGGMISGMQRFTVLSRIELLAEVGRAAAVVLVLSREPSLPHLAAVQLAVASVKLVLCHRYSRRLLPAVHPRLALVDRGVIRQIVTFSGISVILHAATMLALYSDSLVISVLLPISAVTPFAIGANLTDYARSILNSISFTLTPLASHAQARDPGQLPLVAARSIRLSGIVILPVLATFLIRGPTFIGLWMGPEYARTGGNVLRILAAMLCVSASYQMLTSILIGMHRHRVLVRAFLLEAVANLALSVALARPLGVEGVALGTLLPRLAVVLAFAPAVARRELGIRYPAWAVAAWLRPAAAMAPFALGSWLIETLWPAHDLVTFLLQVGAALPLAILGGWVLGLAPEERQLALATLQGLPARAQEPGTEPSL